MCSVAIVAESRIDMTITRGRMTPQNENKIPKTTTSLTITTVTMIMERRHDQPRLSTMDYLLRLKLFLLNLVTFLAKLRLSRKMHEMTS